MSDEKIERAISEPSPVQNQSSIMSAPRDQNKSRKITFIVIAALVASLALNVILAISFVSKNEMIDAQKATIDKREEFIKELETKLNEHSSL